MLMFYGVDKVRDPDTGEEYMVSSPDVIYLSEFELVGAIVEDASKAHPQAVIFTVHMGRLQVSWEKHATELHAYFHAHQYARDARVPSAAIVPASVAQLAASSHPVA